MSKEKDAEKSVITKAAAASKKTRKKTGAMSNHFQEELAQEPSIKPPKVDINEPLYLESATSRRMDWTPPAQKQSAIIDLAPCSSALKEVTYSSVGHSKADMFKNLLDNYGCDEQPPEVVTISDEDSSVLKKRKLIQLVPTKDSSASTIAPLERSPVKQKAPKKKPRTITELATAAYQPQQVESAPSPPSILDDVTNEVEAANATGVDTKGKGKAKAKSRKKPAKVTKKKAQPPKPVLFSPGTALKQVEKQDFVFGTSSQLVREHSPTVLIDIQAAIKQSAEIDVDPFITPVNSDNIEPVERRPNLWEAGARDDNGGLFDLEIINLADKSSQPHLTCAEEDPFGYLRVPDEPSLPKFADAVRAQVNHSFETLSDILPLPKKFTATVVNEDDPFSSDISVSTDVYKLNRSTATTQKDQHNNSLGSLPDKMDTAESSEKAQNQPQRPAYELYTDAQLSKEITSYGFKPVKRRTAMIDLLEQCWLSKHPRQVIRTLTTSATVSQPRKATLVADSVVSPKRPRGRPRKISVDLPPPLLLSESPKRPRGRPRKNSVTSQTGTQEPPPSAQPVESPKRPRGRPRKDAASPSKAPALKAKRTTEATKTAAAARPITPEQPVSSGYVMEIPDSASEYGSEISASPFSSPNRSDIDMSMSLEDDVHMSLAVSPDDEQEVLFDQITKAVTAAPRSTDPLNPSWHEKLLLYDPIVLEDLTVWLNSGQLSKTGYGGEVSPGEVKKWCESKSVCCLWRVNLRGKERKRL